MANDEYDFKILDGEGLDGNTFWIDKSSMKSRVDYLHMLNWNLEIPPLLSLVV